MKGKPNIIDSPNHSFLVNELNVSIDECDADRKDIVVPNHIKDQNVTYGPLDIKYVRNQYGFRSKEFEDVNPDNFNILVMGCSFTQGTGLPVNHTWPSIVGGLLEGHIKKPIDIFSIAKGGSGVDAQVMFLNWLLGTRFKPDLILFMAPSIHRHYLVVGGSDPWETVSVLPNFSEWPTKEQRAARKNAFSIYGDDNAFYKAMVSLHFMDQLCGNRDIPYFISTWCHYLNTYIPDSDLGFDGVKARFIGDMGFIDRNKIEDLELIKEAKAIYPQTIGRDYEHFGPRVHHVVAHRMAETLKRMI